MNTKTTFIYTWKRCKIFLIATILLLMSGILLQISFNKDDLFLFINHRHCLSVNNYLRYLTHLGDGLMMIAIAIAMIFFSYRNALTVAICYATTSIVAQIIKHILHAPRPIQYFKDKGISIQLIEGIKTHHWNSFPSGHTTTAFALGLIISYCYCQRKPFFSNIGLLIIASLIGFSRIYLAQHFFEDVLGGASIGVIISFLTIYGLNKSQWFHKHWLNKGLIHQFKIRSNGK